MLTALASADALTWASILVKASAYATTLTAAGSVLVWFALGKLSTGGRASLRRIAVFAALAAALLSVLRVPIRAGFLMGGTLEGAVDPLLLSMVAESPLGSSVALRLAGLALILAIALPGRIGPWLALAGAGLACASFAFRGHTLGEPRLILGALVTVHMLGLAFWIGAFAPLVRAIRTETPAAAGALAHEFGAKALWVVGMLVVAGSLTLALLGVATPAALATAYGQLFLLKLTIFAGVLSLAALNKLRLTPALAQALPGAQARLRRSIGVEAGLIALVLATTAALTTVTTPPRDQTGERSQTGTQAEKPGPERDCFGLFQSRSLSLCLVAWSFLKSRPVFRDHALAEHSSGEFSWRSWTAASSTNPFLARSPPWPSPVKCVRKRRKSSSRVKEPRD